MSSNTSTPANITSDPSPACPSTFGQWARNPSERQTRFSPNFTDLSCAVPACDNYPAILASCCDPLRETSPLHRFDTNIGPYVSCTLQNIEEEHVAAAYETYQNCLLRHLVDPFKCNDPDPYSITVDACEGQVIEPPALVSGVDEQVCAMRASANATRAMVSCCSGAGANGTEIISFDSGCNIACVSDSADMQECLSERLDNPTEGGGISCSSGANLVADEGTVEGNASSALRAKVQIAFVGAVGLLAVGLLLCCDRGDR